MQAARAAALATVPGAAAYAGRRAVEVALVKYAGLVVQVNRERQFGFISYGEDQLLPPGPPAATAAAASPDGSAASATATADGAPEAPEGAAPAVCVAPAAGNGEPTEQPAGAGAEGAAAAAPGAEVAAVATPAPATEPAAPAASPAKRSRIFFHFKEVGTAPASACTDMMWRNSALTIWTTGSSAETCAALGRDKHVPCLVPIAARS